MTVNSRSIRINKKELRETLNIIDVNLSREEGEMSWFCQINLNHDKLSSKCQFIFILQFRINIEKVNYLKIYIFNNLCNIYNEMRRMKIYA